MNKITETVAKVDKTGGIVNPSSNIKIEIDWRYIADLVIDMFNVPDRTKIYSMDRDAMAERLKDLHYKKVNDILPIPFYFGLIPFLWERLIGWRDEYGRKAHLLKFER